MAAGGSVTKICLAAALAGSVGLALYYGYKKRQKSSDTGENESKKQDEGSQKEAATESNGTATALTKDLTKELKSAVEPVTENIKVVFEKEKPKDSRFSVPTEELKSSTKAAVENVKAKAEVEVKEKTEELKSSAKDAIEKVKGDVKEKTEELKSSAKAAVEKVKGEVKEKTEELKSSAKAATEKVKGKAEELKASIGTSLTESSFSLLGDDKDDKKEKEELLTKDDNDIVVIEETNDKKKQPSQDIVVPESASFAQSLPSSSDQLTSLSALELPSLEADHDSKSSPSASSEQPQSLSTYEFPSLEVEKSKPDDGSDIEVLPHEDKSKHHEKPASDTPAPSHIPKARKDSKKSGASASASAASSSESGNVDSTKDAKPKCRKGSRVAKRKEKDEADASSAEGQKKSRETAKTKPPPVPPKPKTSKSDSSHQAPKEQEVHIKHPTNSGEFVSFGMKFESQDSTPDHIITGVEEGGPASEVGLKDGDMVLKINDMDATHWSRAVLIEQFRMIPSSEFDLTIKRNGQGKYFSVHIMDQADSVAVSGVVIDVHSIPKSNQISLKAAEGSEAVQKCHVVSHTGTCAKVTDQGLSLEEKLVDDESFNFEKICFKEKKSQVVILKTSHKGSPVYITVLNRTTVGVQVYTDIFSTACVAFC